MVIRAFTSSDLRFVLTLVERTLEAYGLPRDPAGLRRDLADIENRYASPRGGFWIAEDAGTAIGTVAIRPKHGTTCELKRLYVSAGARGAGWGQRLYEHAEGFARRAGYAHVWLDSSRRFDKARRLYERNGFTLIEELDNEWEDNVYEKALVP